MRMSITNKWLHEVKLYELLESKDNCGDLVRVYPGTTLDDACRVMAKNHILSAPVFDLKSNNFIGFFDVLELVKYVCDEEEANRRFKIPFGFPSCTSPSSPSSCWNFSSSIIRDVLRKSSRCNEIALMPNTTALWEAIAQLRVKHHQRRILVSRPGTGDNQLLSESDIVRFLDKNRDKLVDVINMKVSQMSLQNIGSPFMSVLPNDKAKDAFYKMAYHDAPCLAVVENNTGRLVGDLSPADLRGITSESYHILHKASVNEFFSHVEGKKAPVCCTANTSLGDLITLVVQNNLHHIWVLDENDKHQRPVAVVTLTDILYSLFRILQS